jgi:hypothetical protein
MVRIFQIAAVILAGLAAYFLWSGQDERAFVAAVVGAVAFFLSIRFQVKERNRVRDASSAEEMRGTDEKSTPET